MKKLFSRVKRFISETDKILFLSIMAASIFGVLMVFSTTLCTLEDGQFISRDATVMIIFVIVFFMESTSQHHCFSLIKHAPNVAASSNPTNMQIRLLITSAPFQYIPMIIVIPEYSAVNIFMNRLKILQKIHKITFAPPGKSWYN